MTSKKLLTRTLQRKNKFQKTGVSTATPPLKQSQGVPVLVFMTKVKKVRGEASREC